MSDANFTVTFWGVRGSIPVPGTAYANYGGNTSCVEVNCGGRTLILDAGTGLYQLGLTRKTIECDLLLSHTHLDHIIGLPSFMPLYNPKSRVHMWSGHLAGSHSLRDVLGMLMQPPLFPLTPWNFKADVEYHDFSAGSTLQALHLSERGIEVHTLPLNHPGGATGYRIEYKGSSVCYITDIEHIPGKLDEALVAFLRSTDMLIYDSTYCDDDFEAHQGWGHSTWQQAVRLAEVAEVKQLAIFHHDPEMDDAQLMKREAELKKAHANAFAAREGLSVHL